MKRKGKVVIFLMLVCFIFSGCRQKESPSSLLGIASSIHVHCRHRQNYLQRRYTNTDKIDIILHYLHKLQPEGRTEEDPELLQGNYCNITIHLSNGIQRIYRIKGNSFLSVDYHPWQIIDSEQSNILFHLIDHIPSDQ